MASLLATTSCSAALRRGRRGARSAQSTKSGSRGNGRTRAGESAGDAAAARLRGCAADRAAERRWGVGAARRLTFAPRSAPTKSSSSSARPPCKGRTSRRAPPCLPPRRAVRPGSCTRLSRGARCSRGPCRAPKCIEVRAMHSLLLLCRCRTAGAPTVSEIAGRGGSGAEPGRPAGRIP